ncbi:RNA polymerase sigma factor SigB [Gracilibacillus halophilus YIM-C55.5]|uniref:RNA polymerase sigma factor n=1 Tax=Gracilibacillus halophilus YIM-C55.5 TaxID=1308866 RepID=N4WAW2_9BACI|nr:RNA polymerase sigma factor SigB [Gracilibacillus halophilus]ENH96399.1 RNA polymerase sigma factor SigB [Gracilibacillus halophilus YIM-C55.5]
MTTKSQRHNNSDDRVYTWIREFQQNPEDTNLQEQIVKTYENLVKSLARKYAKDQMIYEDLVQVGMLGLLAAIRRYDSDVGKSFESFAVPTIVGEIKRFIRDKTWSVHVPRRVKELGPKIKKAIEELTVDQQHSPKIQEIAQHLGVSEEEVLETMEMTQSYNALSVDRKVEADAEGSEVSILDIVGNQDAGYDQVDRQLVLEKILPLLNDREQQIIRCTYFDNKSQKETGELLGISQMHVSRLQRHALRKLREALQAENMEAMR